jgi:hypothetical protein
MTLTPWLTSWSIEFALAWGPPAAVAKAMPLIAGASS